MWTFFSKDAAMMERTGLLWTPHLRRRIQEENCSRNAEGYSRNTEDTGIENQKERTFLINSISSGKNFTLHKQETQKSGNSTEIKM